MKDVNIVQSPDPVKEVPADILAQAICDIADGVKKLNSSRLKRDAVVLLLHAQCRVSQRDIKLVLNALDKLKETWVK